MARRRNSIAHRFARMRGLPPDEKALMQRIANLIDAALNNRQAANPFEGSQRRSNRQVYPPTGLLVKQGIKSVKLIWDATDSNELLRYEVIFDNLTTGQRFVESSFTNNIDFKAAAGTYIARITSVGRDGSTSPVKQVQFSIDEDVMQIEGDKNGPTEVGALVQDNMLLLEGYSVYAWGSAVLDKYIAGSSNEKMVLRLWRSEGADQSFTDATNPPTLLETITLYEATEASSNLDSTARAGLITRPSTGTRVGSFDTSQSVMFSPISVDADDHRKTYTYFLQEVGRTAEDDQVCLSLVMWAGADGTGDTGPPSDPFTPDPDPVFPNLNSFHTQMLAKEAYPGASGTHPMDIRSMFGTVDKEHQLIGNNWTMAFWVRFDDLASQLIGGGTGGDHSHTIEMFTRGAMRSDGEDTINSVRISISAQLVPSPDNHIMSVRVGNRTLGEFANDTATVDYIAAVQGAEGDRSSGLFTWGDASNVTGTQNDAWYFIVVCFSGGNFTGGVPKVRTYMNSITAPETTEKSTAGVTPYMTLLAPSGTDESSTREIIQDDQQTMGYNLAVQQNDGEAAGNYHNGIYVGDLRYPVVSNFQIHQFGMWNVCLDAVGSGQGSNIGSIRTLFNEGYAHQIDWRVNSITTLPSGAIDPENSYWQAENLIHHINYGAVEQPMATGFPGRDTGYHLFRGDMNMTGTSVRFLGDDLNMPDGNPPSTQGFTNRNHHWTDNTTIADVLSPEGTNGTTQFDQAHPGQNLTGGTG